MRTGGPAFGGIEALHTEHRGSATPLGFVGRERVVVG